MRFDRDPTAEWSAKGVTPKLDWKQPVGTKVQSVICSKERFKTVAAAMTWVKSHGFKAEKVDVTTESFRFRQFDPSLCKAGSQRTIELDDGVAALICRRQ